jgi:hypothetical protein
MKVALKDIPPIDFVKSGDIPARAEDDTVTPATELPAETTPSPSIESEESGIDFKSL